MFDEEPDEKLEETVSDAKELYEEIINKDKSELEKSPTVYTGEYEKILKRLNECESGILSDPPDFLNDLFDEIQPNYFRSDSTDLVIATRGLKKILKNYGVRIPEVKSKVETKENPIPPMPQQQFIFSQEQNIHLSITQKNEINNLKEEFDREISKENPNKIKLRDIINALLKIIGLF